MTYDVDKMVLTTICQKCNAKPTKTPLTEFLLPNGLLWIPEILYCPGCGNYVTIQTREMTKKELELRDKEDAEDVAAAEAVLAEAQKSVDDMANAGNGIDIDGATPKEI